jgi:heterodisulfide reductase subunit B
LRPSEITEFDDPVDPSLFESLIEATGAKTIKWPMRLECCGAPVMGINNDLSMSLTGKKINDAGRAGADFLVTACPYCQIQFDDVQYRMNSSNGNDKKLGSILYPQLLGLSMGIAANDLDFEANKIGIGNVFKFLNEE